MMKIKNYNKKIMEIDHEKMKENGDYQLYHPTPTNEEIEKMAGEKQ